MTRRPTAPLIEVHDTLALDPAGRARVRADMLAVVQRSIVPAPGHSVEDMIAKETAAFSRFTDPEVFGRYQRCTMFRLEGEPVGFYYGAAQMLDVEGQQVEVMRAVTATVPGFRAGGMSGRALLELAAHYSRRHLVPRTPRYFAGMAFSPITYEMMGRRSLHLYPSPAATGTPEMRRVFRAIHGDDDLVESHCFATFESAKTHKELAATKSRYGRFFLEMNPHYAEGKALRVLIRVHSADLLYGIAASAALAALQPLRRSRRR